MSAPAAAAEGAEAAPKKGKKKLILILALVLVLLGGGGGGYYFFVMKPAKEKAAAEAAAAEEEDEDEEAAETKKKKDKKKKKKKKKVDAAQIEYMPIEPWFTFNLMDKDPERSGQIGLVFELSSKKAATDLKFKMHVVRSRILFLMSGKYSQELKSPEGKEKLQAQILEVTRAAVDTEAAEEIENVHFSIFVIQ